MSCADWVGGSRIVRIAQTGIASYSSLPPTSTADDDATAPGEDPYYGSGRINVIEAVIAAQH